MKADFFDVDLDEPAVVVSVPEVAIDVVAVAIDVVAVAIDAVSVAVVGQAVVAAPVETAAGSRQGEVGGEDDVWDSRLLIGHNDGCGSSSTGKMLFS